MDLEGTRNAFEELRPLLDEQTELRRIVLDVNKAAAQIAAMGRMVRKDEVRARFAALPRQAFDMQHVDNLENAGLALWYAAVQKMRASVGASRSVVPVDEAEESAEVKQRMLRVAQYHLGDDEAIAAELADIISGIGYADRAADLLRLAQMYEIHEERLSRDPTHYRPGDRRRAGELANRLLHHMGEGAVSEERCWADYVQRAWTFAMVTYEEVCTTGRWLFRHEGGEDRFPSLFKAVRQSSSSRAGGSDIGDVDIDNPALDITAAEAAINAAAEAARDTAPAV